jgi:hypothetical protein
MSSQDRMRGIPDMNPTRPSIASVRIRRVGKELIQFIRTAKTIYFLVGPSTWFTLYPRSASRCISFSFILALLLHLNIHILFLRFHWPSGASFGKKRKGLMCYWGFLSSQRSRFPEPCRPSLWAFHPLSSSNWSACLAFSRQTSHLQVSHPVLPDSVRYSTGIGKASGP